MAKRKSTLSTGFGNIRIIAGKHRGRRLSFPLADSVRPTPDRVKETVFNWLAGFVEGANCLDLFCGSGALGIEALSRSAATVTFVDSSAQVTDNLHNQLTNLGESARIHQQQAMNWLSEQQTGRLFDIIFLDPPFHKDILPAICQTIADKQLVKAGGHVYLEAEASLSSLPIPATWQIRKQKRSGDVQYALCYVP